MSEEGRKGDREGEEESKEEERKDTHPAMTN